MATRSAAFGDRLSQYVAENPNKIVDYVRSYPQEQRAARFMHIWRLVAKDRDANAVRAAHGALAPHVVAALKEGRNVRWYHGFVTAAFEAGHGTTIDKEWQVAKERQNSSDLEKTQVALGQAQNALAKEGIRVALMAVSDHYWLTGDFQNAMKHIGRIRETCSTGEHTAAYCLQAFKFAAFPEGGVNLSLAAPYIQRLEQVTDTLDSFDYARAKVASGLLYLEKRQYRQAMQQFSQLRAPALAGDATTLDFVTILDGFFIRTSDFAQILSLLALSQMDRPGLERFLNNPDFKVMYETEADLRAAVAGFHECRYFDALSKLGGFATQMRLDPFLAPHAPGLLQTVRSKAIRQFVAPFATVQLSKMAEVFHTTPEEVEKELSAMIRNRDIDARIDKTRGALQAAHADMDEQAALKAASLATDVVEDTEMALRTLSMYRNSVCVYPAPPMVHAGGPAIAMGSGANAAMAGGAAAQPY